MILVTVCPLSFFIFRPPNVFTLGSNIKCQHTVSATVWTMLDVRGHRFTNTIVISIEAQTKSLKY